ncbi:MAG TPA: tripartite tricarboxylate transporter permease, partial [Bacillota bacterium]
MGTLDFLLSGFVTALTPENLLVCVLGVIMGTLVGAMPGLGPSGGVAVLLPIAFGMEPVSGLIMLAGLYYGTMYGGTITSVLL